MAVPEGPPQEDPPYDPVYNIFLMNAKNDRCIEIQVQRLEGSKNYKRKNINLVFPSKEKAIQILQGVLRQLQ